MLIRKIFSTPHDPFLTLMRLFLGIVFFAHGSQKVLGWFGGFGLSGTMGFFTGMGMPAVLAALVILGEFGGSLGLLFGFLSRFCALAIILIMTGAIILVHWPNGFFMNWSGQQKGEGFEFHFLAIGLALIILIRGGGAYSVDRLINSIFTKDNGSLKT